MLNKIFFLTALLAILTGVGIYAQELDSWEEGAYMAQVVQLLAETGKGIMESQTDYGYKEGICFLGAYLQKSETTSWSFNVKKDVEYLLIGQGDQDVVDLDISVLDSKGKKLIEDTETDTTPVVTFTAKETGACKFNLNLYDTSTKGSFCGVIILQKSGWDLPVDNIYMASYKSLVFGNELVKNGLDIGFFDLPNQWCLYGAVIEPGKDNSATGLTLGNSNIVAFCAGDEVSSDTDLYLLSEDGKKTIAVDDQVAEVSVVQYKTDAKSKYRLKMVNHTSEGASFLLTSVFVH